LSKDSISRRWQSCTGHLRDVPLLAIAAATLAWRNVYPFAATLIASALTFVGILFVIAFGVIIAMYGF
jgi:hypothetical protein